MKSNTEIESFITKSKMRKGNAMRYTQAELKMALDLIEEGGSFSTVEKITQLNKSILAREMRKRKNSKARAKIGGNYRRVSSKIFSLFPKIITQRLVLREITEQDSESIYKLLSNPEVIKYDTFELFTNIKQAEDLIECFSDRFRKKTAIFWGISLKNESQIIGFCKCEIEIPKIRADFGYDLRPEYWNRGIMTEALDAVIDFTFNKADVNRIEASVSTENNASIRVLEKLGFVKEGVLRKRSYWGGRYHDMVMLSILRDEY